MKKILLVCGSGLYGILYGRLKMAAENAGIDLSIDSVEDANDAINHFENFRHSYAAFVCNHAISALSWRTASRENADRLKDEIEHRGGKCYVIDPTGNGVNEIINSLTDVMDGVYTGFTTIIWRSSLTVINPPDEMPGLEFYPKKMLVREGTVTVEGLVVRVRTHRGQLYVCSKSSVADIRSGTTH